MPDAPLFTAFATVTGLVAVAEIGDKTQLLSLLLAARFRRPLPILAGILVATLLNHALAAWAGIWLEGLLDPQYLKWILGASFLVMAAWTLKPDTLEEDDAAAKVTGLGAFGATCIAFFLAEIGDKTQVATTALAARYGDAWLVMLASTLGLWLANAPVVYLGERLMRRLPLALVRRVAAAAFALVGIATLIGL